MKKKSSAPRPTRKTVKRRANVERPRCNGKLTESGFKNFIVSALRRASSRWAPKFNCIKDCYVGKGVNPATGHPCKLHACPQCGELVPQNMMRSDHVIPVVGPEGFIDFNTFIARLFVEADGYNALCLDCSNRVTKHENKQRRARKASSKTNP